MGKFFNGILVGVGIGLLFAPKKGDEMRSMLSERISRMRSTLPNRETSSQFGQSSQNVDTTENYMKPLETDKSSVASTTTSSSPWTENSQIDEMTKQRSRIRTPEETSIASDTDSNELNKGTSPSRRDMGSGKRNS
jgi:gas vesicle protein